MRIQVISDLHREFGFTDINFGTADILILAGDTDVGTKGISWIKSCQLSIPIIYVLGNHEYYRGSYPKTLFKIKKEAGDSNIHVLENEFIDINNIRFHGTTLWTDFSLFGDPRTYGAMCQEKMNDYRRIRKDPSYSKLRSVDTFQMHQRARAWLTQSLENSMDQNNIVVTHHAPSPRSIPYGHQNDPISSAYASDLETLILRYQPMYWIHGHIHTPTRYAIGSTEIICNPYGYIHEPFNGFDEKLFISV